MIPTTQIVDYLMNNYYSYYKGKEDIVPTSEQIEAAVKNHPDKLVIVQQGDIKGMAFFLTLTDETYQRLDTLDIKKVDILIPLLMENGKNIHFILLAADGIMTIMLGLKRVIQRTRAKTISWWEPDFSYLHRYNLN